MLACPRTGLAAQATHNLGHISPMVKYDPNVLHTGIASCEYIPGKTCIDIIALHCIQYKIIMWHGYCFL